MQFSASTPPTSQKAAERPISFLLDDGGKISAPVILTVRPEDLTRIEPARATVHQTLGSKPSGWVDHFGEGLPSVTIAGHTGWRRAVGTGLDGMESFAALNKLVVHDFPAAKQDAIDRGRDPSAVQLLFVDMLDDFAWSVVPMQFTLRKSKSSPLLFRYNISLQAASTEIDETVIPIASRGTISAGLSALELFLAGVDSLVAGALSAVDSFLGPIAATVRQYVGLVNNVLRMVSGVVQGGRNFVTGVANRLVSIAADLSSVAVMIFRTMNAIMSFPSFVRAEVSRVAAAYAGVLCIFKNSLRSRNLYTEYSGLYGASNCSSTTGGRPASAYAGMGVFELMQPDKSVMRISSDAFFGIYSLTHSDSVLAPMPLSELSRHAENIISGVSF